MSNPVQNGGDSRETTTMSQQEDSIGGLAKRWLKTQLRFHGDPIKARRDQQEADAIEQRMHDKAHDDAANAVVTALVPESWKRKIASLERANEEGRVAREQQRLAEHEARPRVPVTITLSGTVSGTVETELPLLIHPPAQPDDALTLDIEPLEPVEVGDHTFLGLQFAVPEYDGPGKYDLVEIEERTRLDSWDPLWFRLTLDTTDDGLYRSPEYGAGSITVTDSSLHFRAPMSNANGIDVMLDAYVAIPAVIAESARDKLCRRHTKAEPRLPSRPRPQWVMQ